MHEAVIAFRSGWDKEDDRLWWSVVRHSGEVRYLEHKGGNEQTGRGGQEGCMRPAHTYLGTHSDAVAWSPVLQGLRRRGDLRGLAGRLVPDVVSRGMMVAVMSSR